MTIERSGQDHRDIYNRLVALWIICEAFAGGIVHGLKIPFSGLLISSFATLCIILIAYYVPVRSAIIKATIIVAIFKLMLSPHSPPTAYVAVFFQGLAGQLIFYNGRFSRAGAILLGMLALTESAIQRILVLMIVYGNDFWNAVNTFIHRLISDEPPGNYLYAIALLYIFIHTVAGFLIGLYASKLIYLTDSFSRENPNYIIDEKTTGEIIIPSKQKRTRFLFMILWIILAGLFIQSYADPTNAILPSKTVWQIIIRSLLIVLSWYLLVAPLLMMLLKRMLRSQKGKMQQQVNHIVSLIPGMRYIFIRSFELSAAEKGPRRLKLFMKILLMNVLK